jgi:uncharacterized protein YegP (UPF0339 family)
MAGKFEVKQLENGEFMFNLQAGNGQIILTSQRYQAKDSAKDGVESVRHHAADDANYERKTSAAGEPYFVLKAANNQIIGTSEMYTSAAAVEAGIASVKTHAPDAAVVDASA